MMMLVMTDYNHFLFYNCDKGRKIFLIIKLFPLKMIGLVAVQRTAGGHHVNLLAYICKHFLVGLDLCELGCVRLLGGKGGEVL